MNRTGIEWTEYTWNPVTGCLHNCPYCYARAMTERFPKLFPMGFEPVLWPERLQEPLKLKKPSKIFVCSMADLFGAWVPDSWINQVFGVVEASPVPHIFQFLTKNPERYHDFDLPQYAWYGTTVDSPAALDRIDHLRYISDVDPDVTFVSFEPLTELIEPDLSGIDLVIVGGRSAANGMPAVVPEKWWIQTIVDAARRAGAPVFVKDNAGVDPIWPREFPDLVEVED